MTRWLLLSAMLISVSSFADFSDETCKVKSMYDGEEFESKYKGTFGLISTGEKFRMIYHAATPESFNYDEGTAGVMSDETFKGFMEEWCPKLFSKKKCLQIKKIETVEGEKSEGIGFFHFIDEKNAVIARGAGLAGLFGICR